MHSGRNEQDELGFADRMTLLSFRDNRKGMLRGPRRIPPRLFRKLCVAMSLATAGMPVASGLTVC